MELKGAYSFTKGESGMKTYSYLNIWGDVLGTIDYSIAEEMEKTYLYVGRNGLFKKLEIQEVRHSEWTYKLLKRPKNTIRTASITRLVTLFNEADDKKSPFNSSIYSFLLNCADLPE